MSATASFDASQRQFYQILQGLPLFALVDLSLLTVGDAESLGLHAQEPAYDPDVMRSCCLGQWVPFIVGDGVGRQHGDLAISEMVRLILPKAIEARRLQNRYVTKFPSIPLARIERSLVMMKETEHAGLAADIKFNAAHGGLELYLYEPHSAVDAAPIGMLSWGSDWQFQNMVCDPDAHDLFSTFVEALRLSGRLS